MPASEGGPSQPRLELPPGLRANEEVFVCRYTGQIFRDYEEYTRQITSYRQRVWSCRYTGATGLTYEEAVTSEYAVQSVVDQFPVVYEEAALRLVQHCTEPLDVLCATIISHFQSRLVPGEPVLASIEGAGHVPCLVQRVGPPGDGDSPPTEYEVAWLAATGLPTGHASLARAGVLRRPDPSLLDRLTPALLRRWLLALASPEPVHGASGLTCLWTVLPYFSTKHRLPTELPDALAARLRPARGKARGWEGSDADLARAMAAADAVAAAEGGVGGVGIDATPPGRDDDVTESEDDEYRPGAGAGSAGAPKAGGRAGGAKRGPRGAGAKAPKPSTTIPSASGGAAAGAGAGEGGGGGEGGGEGPQTPLAPAGGDAPAAVVDGVGALQGAELLVESLEDVERRIQPGSIKHAVFSVLREAGAEGLSIVDAAARIVDSGLKAWDDARAARNSVASTCGHDPAFMRVGPGRFALRALVPLDAVTELAAMGDGGGGGGGGAGGAPAPASAPPAQVQDKALALVEAQQAEALRRLAEERAKARVARNTFKCPKCHRVAHLEGSPLLLCDTCPRAYHAACLGAAWADLPAGDWACPKCVEATQAALRRVVDLEARRREALDRATARGREAEDRLLRRLLAREEKDKRRGSVGEAVGAGGKGGGVGGGAGGTGAGGLAAVTKARPALDDWDVAEEEREHLALLRGRAAELQAACLGAKAEAPGVKVEDGDAGPGQAGGEEGGEEETRRRVAETQEAIQRLELIIEGPLEPPRLLEDSKEQASLANALDVAEFLQLFGDACEAAPLDLPGLLSGARWPLDGEGLGPLYNQLVLCCLIEQYNHDPPAKARSHRWSRVLTASTWPEVLRRYLLTTRAVAAPPPDDACPLELDNDAVALLAARRLENTPWHRLEPKLHLRLLCTLCYDIAQGYALRNDINVRLQDTIRIQTELFKEQMAWRKSRRGSADAEAAVVAPGPGKKKKAAKKAAAAAEPSEEELQALEAQAEAEAGEDGDEDGENAGTGELDEAQQAWASREAEFEGRLAARSSRADPLGTDRHHRRYWWLASAPGIVMVDGPEDGTPAAIRSKDQLDALLARLNRRGPRERVLQGALRKRYAAICACLEQQARTRESTSYSLATYERPIPRDKRMAVRSIQDLEDMNARAALVEARERLDSFLAETAEVGVDLDCDTKGTRKALRGVENPAGLREILLDLERVYCTAGEGLPPGATDREIKVLLGEPAEPEPEAAAPSGAPNGSVAGLGTGGGAEERAPGTGPEPMLGVEHGAPASATAAAEAPAPGSAPVQPSTAAVTGAQSGQQVPSRPSPTASASAAAATGTTTAVSAGEEGEEGETASGPAPFRPVTRDDDLDDSDAEHAYLREKRMRRPARLWRSARERAAWIQATRCAETPAQAAYVALLLSDRAGPMLQRYITLAEEARKWEAEERERGKAEKAAAAAAGRKRSSDGLAAEPPLLRPMMIRTGKAKTEDGVRVVLKALGREPFPSGRAAAAMDAVAAPEMVAECKWGYQCSVCLLAGDLLCCEHPAGCNVSAHWECSGSHGALAGPWICSNHDDRELKTRIRRRAPGAASIGEDGSGVGADSEATVSEGGLSDDSEATQELNSRRGNKRARR